MLWSRRSLETLVSFELRRFLLPSLPSNSRPLLLQPFLLYLLLPRARADHYLAPLSPLDHSASLGAEIVIEEFLTGPELSILAFSDGYTIRALPGAQDHKRIGDGDVGPNTGGMGAYAPAPVGTPEVLAEVQKALEATISGMRKDGESKRLSLYSTTFLTLAVARLDGIGAPKLILVFPRSNSF